MPRRLNSTDRASVHGRRAWIKRYSDEARRIRLWMLARVVSWLGLAALRPPPRGDAQRMRQTEERRIGELKADAVRVPDVLGGGEDFVLLSDLGQTLSQHLRKASPSEAEQLITAAVRAIAAVHARGAYLGQPLARNITVDTEGRIGFLDFEEDPGEVMGLAEAQTRDWLIFSAGCARHVPFPAERLAMLIAEGLRGESGEVLQVLGDSVQRLRFLPRLTRWLGRRAAALGKAVDSLQKALPRIGVLLLVLLLADFAGNGRIDFHSEIGQWLPDLEIVSLV